MTFNAPNEKVRLFKTKVLYKYDQNMLKNDLFLNRQHFK